MSKKKPIPIKGRFFFRSENGYGEPNKTYVTLTADDIVLINRRVLSKKTVMAGHRRLCRKFGLVLHETTMGFKKNSFNDIYSGVTLLNNIYISERNETRHQRSTEHPGNN